VFAYETDSAGAALSVMAVSGFRHVPVLDVDDKIVGIVSPPRVTAFLQQHFGRR
jgi:CBS domain-containing protein